MTVSAYTALDTHKSRENAQVFNFPSLGGRVIISIDTNGVGTLD